MNMQAETTLVLRPHLLVQLTLARLGKAAIRFLRTKPLGATGVVIVFGAGLIALAAPWQFPMTRGM